MRLHSEKSRLISKQDFDLEHKELEKIIPEKFRELVLILDDNSQVWAKYRENLLQVLPYWFWKHEELKEEISFTEHKDYYLHAVTQLINRAVRIHKKCSSLDSNKKVKLQRVIYELQAKMFTGTAILFSGLAEKSENVLARPEAKIITDRGGTVVTEVAHATLLVTYSFKMTQKVKEAKAKGIPIVYMLWFKYSLKYMAPLSTEFFSLNECTAPKTENMPLLEQQIYEYHHEE